MRKTRKLKPGAKYHATARANLQEFILKDDVNKAMLKKTIIQAKRKYLFKIIHFSIMDNHLHLIIKPTGRASELSDIMPWMIHSNGFGVFAIRYNKKYGLKGHVWYDRFHSQIIDSKIYEIVDPPDEDLLNMFPYLAA